MEFNCENCGWSKVVESSVFCEYSGKGTFRENCCEAWKPKNNPITNADKIRQMSDEELAEFLAKQEYRKPTFDGWLPLCNHVMGDRICHRNGCKECWIDWLKQEEQ